MYLYRHIQKWIYHNFLIGIFKFIFRFSKHADISTADISPIQRNPLLNSAVTNWTSGLKIRFQNLHPDWFSAAWLLQPQLWLFWQNIKTSKELDLRSNEGRFLLFQSKLVFWYQGKEMIPADARTRNFWSRIFHTLTVLICKPQIKCRVMSNFNFQWPKPCTGII